MITRNYTLQPTPDYLLANADRSAVPKELVWGVISNDAPHFAEFNVKGKLPIVGAPQSAVAGQVHVFICRKAEPIRI